LIWTSLSGTVQPRKVTETPSAAKTLPENKSREAIKRERERKRETI